MKFFQVMGDGRRANDRILVQRTARDSVGGGNLLKNGEAARIRERSRDRVKPLVGESWIDTGRLGLHIHKRCDPSELDAALRSKIPEP